MTDNLCDIVAGVLGHEYIATGTRVELAQRLTENFSPMRKKSILEFYDAHFGDEKEEIPAAVIALTTIENFSQEANALLAQHKDNPVVDTYFKQRAADEKLKKLGY